MADRIGTKPPLQPALPPIDWGRLEDKVLAEIQRGLHKWREAIKKFYVEEASKELGASRTKYLAGLSSRMLDDGIEITISGWLPTALESGSDRFDLKPGFLQGRAHRVIPVGAPDDVRFRTVSTNSPAHTWWHPGIQARNISGRVKERSVVAAQQIFGDLFARIKA